MKVSRGSIITVVLFLVVAVCIYVIFGYTEGFKALMTGDSCGVDLKSCASERKCMNGVCYSTDKPCLPKNELEVYP